MKTNESQISQKLANFRQKDRRLKNVGSSDLVLIYCSSEYDGTD